MVDKDHMYYGRGGSMLELCCIYERLQETTGIYICISRVFWGYICSLDGCEMRPIIWAEDFENFPR